jgi:hypothetical protein
MLPAKGLIMAAAEGPKVFWFFSSEKNSLLAFGRRG